MGVRLYVYKKKSFWNKEYTEKVKKADLVLLNLFMCIIGLCDIEHIL